MQGQDDADFDKDLDEAQATLDAKFASKLKLPADLLQTICPTPVERKALEALMQAVNGAASENEAKAQLIKHAENCGVVIVRLLKIIAI